MYDSCALQICILHRNIENHPVMRVTDKHGNLSTMSQRGSACRNLSEAHLLHNRLLLPGKLRHTV
jgi:hypothetical protein